MVPTGLQCITMKVKTLRQRWPKDQVLKVARERTHSMSRLHQARVQRMLASLLREAGWSEEEFLNVFIDDVTASPSLRRGATR